MLIIKTYGLPEESLIPTDAGFWGKLLEHGMLALIVAVCLFFFVGVGWTLRARIADLLLSWKRQSDTMTEELPAIRRGVERLAEESTSTLRRVHEDVTYIKGAVARQGEAHGA